MTRFRITTEEFLYDLQAGPCELTNLVGYASHREVADALRQCLIRWMTEAGEAKPSQRHALPEEVHT